MMAEKINLIKPTRFIVYYSCDCIILYYIYKSIFVIKLVDNYKVERKKKHNTTLT
jgi:hypothetical protein